MWQYLLCVCRTKIIMRTIETVIMRKSSFSFLFDCTHFRQNHSSSFVWELSRLTRILVSPFVSNIPVNIGHKIYRSDGNQNNKKTNNWWRLFSRGYRLYIKWHPVNVKSTPKYLKISHVLRTSEQAVAHCDILIQTSSILPLKFVFM